MNAVSVGDGGECGRTRSPLFVTLHLLLWVCMFCACVCVVENFSLVLSRSRVFMVVEESASLLAVLEAPVKDKSA